MKKGEATVEPLSRTEERLISQWDREKTKKIARIAIITLIILAAILIAFFIIFSKISITISNELDVIITPAQQSITRNNSERVQLEFEIKNDNLIQCAASCKFELFPPDNKTAAYTSSETLSHGQTLKKSFEISLPGRGSGQELYSFKATCHNYKSVLCLTNEEERISRAVVIINYELTSDEKGIKEEYKPRIEKLILSSSESKQKLQAMPKRAIPEGTLEGNALRKELLQEEKLTLETQAHGDKMLQLWGINEFLQIKSEFNLSLLAEAQESQTRLDQARTDFEQLILFRNRNANNFAKFSNSSPEAKEAITFYQEEENPENDKRLAVLKESADNILDTYFLIKKNITHSEEQYASSISNATATVDASLAEYDRIRAEITFMTIYSKYVLLQKNITLPQQVYGCQALSSAQTAFTGIGNNTASNTTNFTKDKDPERANLTRIYIEQTALNETIVEAQALRLKDSDHILEIARRRQVKMPEFTPTQDDLMSSEINLTDLILTREAYCKNNSYTSTIPPFDLNRLNNIDDPSALRIVLEINSTQDIEPQALPDNPSICCAGGTCGNCCDTPGCRNKDYPILLIHGHAFNSKASPEFSLTLFSELQEKLSEDGYVNLGKLEMDDPSGEFSPNNDNWGRQPTPVTFKSSYYYISHYDLGDYVVSVQNDESIESYAIRLKEIIEKTKEKTGKDKVTLVAHSMGGLVAREYIYLFGDGSVNKLITINTPHKGVTGRTKDWCTILGSSKECEEMSQGSIFLSRLNSRKIPPSLKAYAIRSTGCKMENGAEGDGVVLAQNAEFDGAKVYTVSGNCTDALQSSLHNDILSPSKYPLAYEILLGFLKED